MSELKPCPYCGAEAIAVDQHGSVYHRWMPPINFVRIECTGCKAKTAYHFPPSEAVEIWNRRVE